MLDGCGINQHFWVFGGAATNVKYQIRVTDLVTDDGVDLRQPAGPELGRHHRHQAFETCT